MIRIVSGALILSLLHAMLPSHWIPFVAIGRGERWSTGETLFVTAVAGGAHIAGTILVGIVVGLVGIGFSSSYQFLMRVASPGILVLLGLVFIWNDLRRTHPHKEVKGSPSGSDKRSKSTIIASLALAMFLSPCLEIEAYYFTVGGMGWSAIMWVSLVYMIVTMSGMLLLVYLGLHGLERLRWDYLELHEKRVTGVVLVILGAITYLARSY